MKKLKKLLYVLMLCFMTMGIVTSFVPEAGIITEVQAATKPAAPVLVSATRGSGKSIVVKWKAVSGATGYRVYRRTSATGSWKSLKTIKNQSTVSFTDTDISANKVYTYTVRAYKNVNGQAVWSNYDTTGVGSIVLTIPTPSSAKFATGKSIKFTWKAVSAADGYYVYRRTGSSTTWVKRTDIKNPSTVSYTDKSVTAGTTYTYTVRAYKMINGTRVFGNYNTTGKKVTMKPPAVSLVSASVNSSNYVTVKWNKITDVYGYRVYRKEYGESSKITVATIKDDEVTSYVDKTAKAGKKYTYTVRAFLNKNGTAVWGAYDSTGKTVTIPSVDTVATNTNKLKTYLKSYGSYVDGWYVLGTVRSTSDYDYTWMISYAPSTDEFEYTMMIEAANDILIMSMLGNPAKSSTMKVSYLYYYESVGAGLMAEASFNASTYTGQDLTFAVTDIQNLSSSDRSTILGAANDALRLGFEGWEAYVLNEIGLSVKTLGFKAL